MRRAGDTVMVRMKGANFIERVQNPFYIATSKGPGPTALLLRELLGIDLPPDSPRLMTGLIPPEARKAEALRCDTIAVCLSHRARL